MSEGQSRGEGKPRPSRARIGGISFFFIMSFLSKFNLDLDFPSRGVTGLIVYFSDLHTPERGGLKNTLSDLSHPVREGLTVYFPDLHTWRGRVCKKTFKKKMPQFVKMYQLILKSFKIIIENQTSLH